MEDTYLAEARILCCPQSIPMVVVSRTHKPIEQFGFFLIGPMFRSLCGAIGVKTVGYVVFSSSLDVGDNIVDWFAFQGR